MLVRLTEHEKYSAARAERIAALCERIAGEDDTPVRIVHRKKRIGRGQHWLTKIDRLNAMAANPGFSE